MQNITWVVGTEHLKVLTVTLQISSCQDYLRLQSQLRHVRPGRLGRGWGVNHHLQTDSELVNNLTGAAPFLSCHINSDPKVKGCIGRNIVIAININQNSDFTEMPTQNFDIFPKLPTQLKSDRISGQLPELLPKVLTDWVTVTTLGAAVFYKPSLNLEIVTLF